MNTSRRWIGAVVGVLVLALVGGESAAAAPQADCNARLTVELTPDVPDASDAGFLSSLLDNHPAYRVELLKQLDPSLIEVEFSGPGPGYLCQDVVDAMRRDARIVSIHVDSAESPWTLTGGVSTSSPQLWGVPVSGNGIGSLYWAAHHPGRALTVLLPIRSQNPGGVE